ncbi:MULTISPECIES: DUF2635 domain-containing protein [Mangrovibacter]|uniref:DUF2635 domain-containing protein n=1 Tax=Mangrovibacter TaxID=451512 RepID=UPI0004D64BD8|nr:DUF2635 domain-containing protein [Mangrovibacter sp. MFB070]KEA54674.1 hypothetical protein DT73_00480 [Mangrovibacter sp. MFB070]
MFVKPKDGLSVRDPVKGSPLPAEGAEVPNTIFWRRRLSDGDVSITEKPVTPLVATVKSTTEKNEGGTE